MASDPIQTTDEHPAWDRYREARRELIHLNAYAAQATQRMLDAKRELELAGEWSAEMPSEIPTTEVTCREEGELIALHGCEWRVCPYPPDTQERDWWMSGYEKVEREMEAANAKQ